MCHALQDPAFFRFLSQIDAQFAAEARQRRCPECAGPLHVADFPCKPRGCPAAVREEYSSRLSFTCGRCDARTTPASVRFLGRRVYVAVMLMLASPPAGAAAGALADLMAVPVRTVRRWRHELAACTWRHPLTGLEVRFGASTIERWYYAARGATDPMAVLRNQIRSDIGSFPSVSAQAAEALRAQYLPHQGWTAQLHHDNLRVVLSASSPPVACPSYRACGGT